MDYEEVDSNDPRYQFFLKLRNLILEKEKENDQIAAAILGWAYERLSE